jgi:hypothetical protein
MVNNGLPHPNFKGFMVDSAQANWNAICIVYGSNDQTQPMVDKECTCYFHWTQSMDKHTKQYIKPELHERHKALCYEYKNATSLEEVDARYATICC